MVSIVKLRGGRPGGLVPGIVLCARAPVVGCRRGARRASSSPSRRLRRGPAARALSTVVQVAARAKLEFDACPCRCRPDSVKRRAERRDVAGARPRAMPLQAGHIGRHPCRTGSRATVDHAVVLPAMSVARTRAKYEPSATDAAASSVTAVRERWQRSGGDDRRARRVGAELERQRAAVGAPRRRTSRRASACARATAPSPAVECRRRGSAVSTREALRRRPRGEFRREILRAHAPVVDAVGERAGVQVLAPFASIALVCSGRPLRRRCRCRAGTRGCRCRSASMSANVAESCGVAFTRAAAGARVGVFGAAVSIVKLAATDHDRGCPTRPAHARASSTCSCERARRPRARSHRWRRRSTRPVWTTELQVLLEQSWNVDGARKAACVGEGRAERGA